MKGTPAIIGGVLVVLLLPILAVAAVAGAIIPAATSATTCADPAAAMSGTWRPPLIGSYTVTSPFGMRYHPVLHITKLHTGIDLVARADKTVVAAAAGTVKVSGYNGAYGNQVVIDNGGGIQTRYAHMASASPVSVGQKVAAGTRLGTQGATGYVTGAHLHFEVIKKGSPIDPKPFMASQGAPLNGGATSAASTRTTAALATTASTKTKTGTISATRTDGQKVTLNNEQLTNAATIARIGRKVGAGDHGVVIALMAALQESVLRNLNYGDRDSLGLFQQRAGWGTTQQRRTPEYAARAFFGGPSGPNEGSPAGLLDKRGWKSMGLGQAAQAVQVSAFPTAYDKWEPVARAIVDAKGLAGRTAAGDCVAGGSAHGQLQVATWNICLEFCGGGKLRPWRDRIPLIAAVIKKAHPDVISLQETGREKTQGAAIIKALAPTYKLAVYKRSKMVLYDPTKLSTTSASGKKLGSVKFVVEGKGGVAQVLRDLRTGKTVVVSSLHPIDGTKDARRLRYVEQAHQLVVGLHKKNPGSAIIHAGDLNSYIPGTGTKKKVAQFFTDRGYRTAEQIAKTRTGQEYRSYNGGKAPRRGPRIDHVIVDPRTTTVSSWRQILSTNRSDPESDHNMIVVILTLSGTGVASQHAV